MKTQYPGSSCPTTSGARPLNGNLPTTTPAPATNMIVNTLRYTTYWLYCHYNKVEYQLNIVYIFDIKKLKL